MSKPNKLSLVAALGLPFSFRHGDRTYWLSQPCPLSRANISTVLRRRRLSAARNQPAEAQQAAMADVLDGKADVGGEWADDVMGGRGDLSADGMLLLLWSLLSVRHPDISEDDVCRMVADDELRPEILETLTLAMSAGGRTENHGGDDDDPPNWEAIYGVLLREYPGWTFADLSRLTDSQIAVALKAKLPAEVRSAPSIVGEWSMDELLGPDPAAEPAASEVAANG